MKKLKECRFVKAMYLKNGSGSMSARVNLPIPWITEMGISPDQKDLAITFDGEKIIIEKR